MTKLRWWHTQTLWDRILSLKMFWHIALKRWKWKTKLNEVFWILQFVRCGGVCQNKLGLVSGIINLLQTWKPFQPSNNGAGLRFNCSRDWIPENRKKSYANQQLHYYFYSFNKIKKGFLFSKWFLFNWKGFSSLYKTRFR